jgi:hypothetical protein
VGEATSSSDADKDYTNSNWVSGFAGGTSDSNTTHLLFVCSMVFDDVYYDQLSLSKILPSAPGF